MIHQAFRSKITPALQASVDSPLTLALAEAKFTTRETRADIIPDRNVKWNRKFPEFPNFQKKRTTSRGWPKFSKWISGNFLFHSILNRNFRKFWSNGTRPPFIPEIFQWNEPKSRVPFTTRPECPEFLVNGKRSCILDINLVPRVFHLTAPWSERGKTRVFPRSLHGAVRWEILGTRLLGHSRAWDRIWSWPIRSHRDIGDSHGKTRDWVSCKESKAGRFNWVSWERQWEFSVRILCNLPSDLFCCHPTEVIF